MSVMVERVACAIFEATRPGMTWRSHGCETRPYLEAARAAIEAMRKPTIPMQAINGSANWSRMIDEALK